MGTATGFTADRMLAIEAASVVDGDVVGDNLILTKHDGSTIDAGNVRGPAGTNGTNGADGLNGDTVWSSEKVLNKNPYFEILNGTAFATWQIFWKTGTPINTVETTPANVYEGTQSAKCVLDPNETQRYGTNVFNVQPYEMIRVRARVKADGPLTALLNFATSGAADPDPDYFATNSAFQTDYSQSLTLAGGWTLIEKTFIIPAGAAKARAWVSLTNPSGAPATQTGWIDNAEVIPVLQSFMAATPLLQNFRAACNTSNPIASITVTVGEQSKIQLGGYVTFYTSAGGYKTVSATCNGVTAVVGELYFNETTSHKAIPINGLFGPLPAGTYTITFTINSGTLDANDYYNITAREVLPVGWQAPTLTDSGRIYVGSAGAAPFVGGWTNYDPSGNSWERAFYHKIGKQTMIGGLVYNATTAYASGQVIFTLPVGFRPPEDLHVVTTNGGNGSSRINIMRSGDVRLNYSSVATAVGASGWWSLANICFPNSV